MFFGGLVCASTPAERHLAKLRESGQGIDPCLLVWFSLAANGRVAGVSSSRAGDVRADKNQEPSEEAKRIATSYVSSQNILKPTIPTCSPDMDLWPGANLPAQRPR